jgi:uncharacterized membrane-anchored protein YitT (DUF2179 family)
METVKKNALDVVFITIGALIAAMALEMILKPNNILDGGVVGISMILSHIFHVKLGILTIVLNIPFLILGFKQIGIHFLAKAGYAMAVFSAALSVFEKLSPVTHDGLLATAFGGMLLGIGVGLVLKFGGCLDGTEALAILISKKTSISIGQFILSCNVVIYCVAGFLYGIESTMYSLLTYFLVSKVMDLIQDGLNKAKAVMIITNEYENMANAIYQKLGRTVTIMNGSGLISGEKYILYCVVTRMEISELKMVIKEQDISAFITISDVAEIVGNHIKSNSIA